MSTTQVVDDAEINTAGYIKFVAWRHDNPTKNWAEKLCELANKTADLITEAKNAEAARINFVNTVNNETTASDSPSPEKRIRR